MSKKLKKKNLSSSASRSQHIDFSGNLLLSWWMSERQNLPPWLWLQGRGAKEPAGLPLGPLQRNTSQSQRPQPHVPCVPCGPWSLALARLLSQGLRKMDMSQHDCEQSFSCFPLLEVGRSGSFFFWYFQTGNFIFL